jgi:hypothetical protein
MPHLRRKIVVASLIAQLFTSHERRIFHAISDRKPDVESSSANDAIPERIPTMRRISARCSASRQSPVSMERSVIPVRTVSNDRSPIHHKRQG